MEINRKRLDSTNLNLIEVSILISLNNHRGRLVTVDIISKELENQTYIYKYIGGLVQKNLVEQVDEDKYRVSNEASCLKILQK